MAKRPKSYGDTTVPPISGSFEEIVRAVLGTPPPPAGDPSTRRRSPEGRSILELAREL